MSDLSFACVCDTSTYPYHEIRRVARKEHACYEGCGKRIKPGEWYMDVGGLCEGEWWSGKICRRCWTMYEWVKAHIPCVCVTFGNMYEDLLGICQEASGQAPGLLFGFYRRVLSGDRYAANAAG